jgi:Icc-related predicted phosphoesterase
MRQSPTRLFFATDLHGADVCFRKFVNAARFYDVSLLFLGGDLSGKMLVPIWKRIGGYEVRIDGWVSSFDSQAELASFCRTQADRGLYAAVVSEADYKVMTREERQQILDCEIRKRLSGWLDFASGRLRGTGTRIIAIAGNDDPQFIDDLLHSCEVVTYADSKVIEVADGVQVLGFGYSTPTPWNTPRELSDAEIAAKLEVLTAQLKSDCAQIFHVHVPPFGSGLDACVQLDAELRPVIGPGGPVMTSVGSHAVRQAIEQSSPALGLFGHVHEGRAMTRLGRTVCLNPGSNYGQGTLLGALTTIDGGVVTSWQLTEG